MQKLKDLPVNGTPPSNIEEANHTGPSSLIFQAIENSDGVPFQLIFGRQIGEGFYLKIGKGIGELPGVAPEDFSERINLNTVIHKVNDRFSLEASQQGLHLQRKI